MKTVIGLLLVLLICITASGCRKEAGGSSTDPTQSATKFVTLLSEGKFGAAVNMLEPSLQTITPAARLRNAWQMYEKDFGSFQELKGAKLEESTGGEHSPKSVVVTCRFAKSEVNVGVSLNVDQKVMNWSAMPSGQQKPPSGK